MLSSHKLDRTKNRIKWCFAEDSDVVLTTSGGKTSFVLPHLVHDVLSNEGREHPPIVFVDTLYYPDSTYKHVKTMSETYPFDVLRFSPDASRKSIEETYGAWWENQDKEVVRELKHKPLNEAFTKLQPDIWIKGLCQDDQSSRQNISLKEHRNGLIHFHPLVDWEQSDLTDYLEKHGLPINEAHFDLTKNISEDSECGIHEQCGLE